MTNTIDNIISTLYDEIEKEAEEKTAAVKATRVKTDIGKDIVKLAALLRTATVGDENPTIVDVEGEFATWNS